MLQLLCTPSTAAPAPRESGLGPGWVVLGRVCSAGRGFLSPRGGSRHSQCRCGGESPRWRPCGIPGSCGHLVAVFPRSAPGVIAQTGTWGNSHPSPGMVMSEEDSKTNGSLRSSAALQDFSSHQPLHQQRQHLSRSLSQPWRRSCQAAGAGAKINHVLNNVPSPSNGLSSASRLWSRVAALGWGPGASWIWGWCWEVPILGEKGCVRAGLNQGRCPQLWGARAPQLCQDVRIFQVFGVLDTPSPVGVPAICAGFSGLPSGLSKHLLLHSYLQILSLCSSFMTFNKSCLIPFFQRCSVGSCPSQPSAGSACLQLLCFLLLTVIGFDFLIAASVFL
nr:uncharacterized protein LOC113459937 [Zonotrichia albicollis]